MIDMTGGDAFWCEALGSFKARTDVQNAKGGVGGRPIGVVVADGQSTPQGNLAAVQFLVERRALGVPCSGFLARCARPRVGEFDVATHHEPGHPCDEKLEELLWCEISVALLDNNDFYVVAGNRVAGVRRPGRDTDARTVQRSVVQEDCCFSFERGDVVPPMAKVGIRHLMQLLAGR